MKKLQKFDVYVTPSLLLYSVTVARKRDQRERGNEQDNKASPRLGLLLKLDTFLESCYLILNDVLRAYIH
jgi:hypothetical protein